MKIKFLIFTLLFIAAFCPAKVFADSPEQQLDQARKLVQQKSYDEALKLYIQISDWLRKDPGLVIEWARVYAYADKHPKAIALFEEVRGSHPEREAEIISELADQYKWDGQLNKSIIEYHKALSYKPNDEQLRYALAQALAWNKQHKEALKEYEAILTSNPQSTIVLLGKAELLSWQDKLEEASKLYDQVLKTDPANLTAQNGLARILVWQGYHHRGIAAYTEILKNHPDNLDALEGLSFAYHWRNQNDLALVTLDKLFSLAPERHAAKQLYQEVDNAKKPYFSQGNRFSEDKYKQAIQAHEARAGMYAGNFLIEGIDEWIRLRKFEHNTIHANRGGLGMRTKITDSLGLNSYIYGTKYDFEDYSTFTTDSWVTYIPDDYWRLDAGFSRSSFEDIDALFKHIIVNSSSMSVDFRPDRWWFFNVKYSHASYNDGNAQNTGSAKLEYRLHQDPYIKLYSNFYYTDFSDVKSNGYFNPSSMQAYTIGIYASKQINRRLFLEGQTSIGYEDQDPPQFHRTHYASLGLGYRLNHNWDLSLRGEYFDARPDSHSKGYAKKSGFLTLTYTFGGTPPSLPETSTPSRPLTGR
ncbi:MAG: tetratricopeptide repeat protein [Candidatus Omnitrophica bacterium]|nr:tetratricopeptide repeat protein [Candidatus Omnitrophota bacterium]